MDFDIKSEINEESPLDFSLDNAIDILVTSVMEEEFAEICGDEHSGTCFSASFSNESLGDEIQNSLESNPNNEVIFI